MTPPLSLSLSSAAIMVATVLAGCVSQTPEERLANMGPVYGPSTINYTVASDGAIDLDSAVDVAKTLGRYRRLNVDESETVRRLAQEKFDGFVIKEVRRLQPAYAAKKKEIKLYSQNLVASATPAETEKIRREEALSLDKLNDEIRSQAVIAVRRRYGSQIAVPLKTRDNKPVVAIAKIRGDKVSAPGTAIELDRKPGSVIQHQGQKTAVIGNQVTLDP